MVYVWKKVDFQFLRAEIFENYAEMDFGESGQWGSENN